MLQQTQVAAVIPYFERFVARFPDLAALARADEDAVLRLWSGLGYYARARNLHRAARLVMERHTGAFPSRFEDIAALPGIGRSTAGAIAVFAFAARHPILDGNVKRVFARFFGIEGPPHRRLVQERFWQQAEAVLPQRGVPAYTQGLMDLGATVCTRARPRCGDCPLTSDCVARSQDRITALPTPRARRVLPQRVTRMLILAHGTDILLERRPSAGLWGGLWCFPELPSGLDAAGFARMQFGVEVEEIRSMPLVAHGFTHFLLDIQPLRCVVRTLHPRAEGPGRIWSSLADALGAAIPTPVRKILRAMCVDQESASRIA